MAVAPRAITGEIGRSFAERIRAEPTARALRVRAARGGVELWLVTAPADPDTAYRFYEAGAAVEAQFPDVELYLHVLNARNYPHVDPLTLIPAGAEEVPLRPE